MKPKSQHACDKTNWCRKLAQAWLTSHQGSGLQNADVMFAMLPRGDKVARRVESATSGIIMRMRKLLSPTTTLTPQQSPAAGVNNTCATTTPTTTTAPGGHGGGHITLFRNRHYNPGNGNITGWMNILPWCWCILGLGQCDLFQTTTWKCFFLLMRIFKVCGIKIKCEAISADKSLDIWC